MLRIWLVTLLLLGLTLQVEAQAQPYKDYLSKKEKKEGETEQTEEEDNEEKREILELNKDNFQEKVIKEGENARLWIIFTESDNRQVRRAIKDIAKLANYTAGEPQVARVFCNLSPMICKQLQVFNEFSLP